MSFLDNLYSLRGRPIQIKFGVDCEVFEYGRTYDIHVSLRAFRHIKIKNARLDLVIEKHYAETFTHQVAGRGHSGIFLPAKKTVMIPKQEVVEKSEFTVSDSSDLHMTSTRLGRGESLKKRVTICMPSRAQSLASTGHLSWSLDCIVDIESDDEFSEQRSILKSLKINIGNAKDEVDNKSSTRIKEYLSYLKSEQTAAGKKRSATTWTAIIIVSLSILSLGGELYRPLDHMWTLAMILWVVGVGVAIRLGISGKREIGGGIMQGIGIGLIALSLTWFDIGSVFFFLDYFRN